MRRIKKLALFLTFFSFAIILISRNNVFAASTENATDAALTENVTEEASTENAAEEASTESATEEASTENVAEEASTENVAEEASTENVAEEASTEKATEEATTENVADITPTKSAADEVPTENATSTENAVADAPPTDNGANLTETQKAVADAIITKIAPDGKNAVFKIKKPTNPYEAESINGYVNNLVNSLLQEKKYEISEIYASCVDPYTTCIIQIYSDDYKSQYDSSLGQEVAVSGWKASYTINVTYDEPETDSVVNSYVEQLNDFDWEDRSTYYFVEDLSLINYYLTGNKSELWNTGAASRALKFSTLNNVTSGSNVTYYLASGAGYDDKFSMYESAEGFMSIFYNGYSYGTKEEGVYLKRVIYVPEETEDTTDSYVAAAQKRINDYLGNSSVEVSYGGTIESLQDKALAEAEAKAEAEGWFFDPDSVHVEDPELPIDSDKNYYKIKVGERSYNFYIVEAAGNKLVEPTYLGTDIESNIQITSENSSIPLDTSLTVKSVNDSSIKDKIGTENYKSYDISLHSDAKGAKIEKLESGEFNVKIPVPTELNGKELVVYYITEKGEKEEHEVTIKDGYAIFTTDHFSIYTLAEKVLKAETPQTPAPDAEITNKPQTPAPDAEITNKPQAPQTEAAPADKNNDASPKTGDSAPIIPVVCMLFVSLVVGLALRTKRSEF